jgi:hypothetical protein|nr:MAG TPA: hypothetical protein [Caudoviricetes sp.]
MIITEALMQRIRTLLNEVIPDGGSEADTHFSMLDLTITLQMSESENHALYLLWTQKAGIIQRDAGEIKSISAGGEAIEKYTAADYVNLCLKTAQGYKEAWEADRKNAGASFLICSKKDDDEAALW